MFASLSDKCAKYWQEQIQNKPNWKIYYNQADMYNYIFNKHKISQKPMMA